MNAKSTSLLNLSLALLLAALTLQGCNPAPNCAVTEYIVSKFNDTNDGVCDTDCSLREAVDNSNACPGVQTITLATGVYTLSIAGADEDLTATGDLDIMEDVVINGALGGPGVVIDGGGLDRVFEVIGPSTAVTMRGLTIQNGRVALESGFARGGGILNAGELGLSETNLLDNLVEGAASGWIAGGGGIYNMGTLSMTGSQVSGNEVMGESGYGGGIFNSGSMSISEITFEGNQVTNQGGGLYNDEIASANVGNANLNDNQADKGGGLANAGTLTLERVSLSGNLALTHGGGIFLSGDLSGNMVSLIGNQAQSDGGAIFQWETGSLYLEHSNMESNQADGFGGGMYLENGAVATFNMGSLLNNDATAGPGAVFVDHTSTSLSMTNVTLSGNQGSGGMSALFVSPDSTVLLDSVTIFNNKPEGLAALGTATVQLFNTILAANGVQNCNGGGLVSNGGNLDSDGTCALVGPGDQTGVDPLLMALVPDAGVGQVHPLDIGSPAIDAGSASCPATDQRGAARPQGAGCDSGAYETGFVPLPISSGTITGRICYPSDHVPPMTLYFENVDDGSVEQFSHETGQGLYSVEVPAGTYLAYAYKKGSTSGGTYSAYVLCGGGINCTDHTLFEFEVIAGETTGDIDICDYYGEADSVPSPPGGFELDQPMARFVKNGFCRYGPDVRYRDITALEAGSEVPVEGRNAPEAPSMWWWILLPESTAHCWVSDSVVEVFGPVEGLMVVQAPPPPPDTPATLTIAERRCNQKTYTLQLMWGDVANETGYRVYRNGALIATLGANTTSFVDSPAFGGPYSYSVEAYNASGVSNPATVTDQVCNP